MQKAFLRGANKARVENYWGHPRCMLISSEKLQKTVGFGNERGREGGEEETENRDRSDVNWSKYSACPHLAASSYTAPNTSRDELG